LTATRAIVAEVERQRGAEIGPREGKRGPVQVAGILLGPENRERPRHLVVAGGEQGTRIEPRRLGGTSIALALFRLSVASEIRDLDEAANGAARAGIGEKSLHGSAAPQVQIDPRLLGIALREQQRPGERLGERPRASRSES